MAIAARVVLVPLAGALVSYEVRQLSELRREQKLGHGLAPILNGIGGLVI
jgi:hypothetical protein